MNSLNETMYEIHDNVRRVQLVKRYWTNAKRYYIKVNTGILMETDDFKAAYSFYNAEAAKINQKWGQFSLSHNTK